MADLSPDARTKFEQAASAWIASLETLEAVVAGDVDLTIARMDRPWQDLNAVLDELRNQYGSELRGIVFRGWLFLLPTPLVGLSQPSITRPPPIKMSLLATLD